MTRIRTQSVTVALSYPDIPSSWGSVGLMDSAMGVESQNCGSIPTMSTTSRFTHLRFESQH